MFGRKRTQWDRYLEAVRRPSAGRTVETGPPPSPGQASPATAARPRERSRTFALAALRTIRAAGGLIEFALWLGMNLIVVMVIILAAQAAGAHLPPWLAAAANFIQAALARAAQAFGFGR